MLLFRVAIQEEPDQPEVIQCHWLLLLLNSGQQLIGRCEVATHHKRFNFSRELLSCKRGI